jgi:hypothetical protein
VSDIPSVTVNKSPVDLPQSQQPPFQSQQSFVQRLLTVAVKLVSNSNTAQPTTFPGGSDTVTLTGSRMSARIENNGAPAGGRATLSVWGLTPSLMNQLSTLGMIYNQVQRNAITISAGNAGGATPTVVFSGTVVFAYGDYNQAPNVPFVFECQSGLIDAVAPATPLSYPGPSVDVANVMSGIAAQMGLTFENNGVSTKLSASYFPGNAWTQAQKCAADAHINVAIIPGSPGKLSIWSKGGSRTSQATTTVPLISPDTGADGYPTFAPNGYLVSKFIFDPRVTFGTTIQIQSSLPQANKTWVVQKLDLALDCLMPKGQWLSTAFCYPLGFAAPTPQAT